MKYLMLTLILTSYVFVVACTSSEETTSLTEVKELRDNLNICQAQLETYRSSSTYKEQTRVETQSEPEQPSAPEYEEITVYEVDGTKCTSTDDNMQMRGYRDGEVPACGRSFWHCKDGAIRECMTNVKYKTSTEQRLIEE